MRTRPTTPRYAVGLYRVSTAEQGQSGLGLEAQQASVRTFVAAQGWTLVAEFSDVASGKDDRRAGFQAALARCRPTSSSSSAEAPAASLWRLILSRPGAWIATSQLARLSSRATKRMASLGRAPVGSVGECCCTGRLLQGSRVASGF